MSKLFAIISCLVFSLGIIVTSMATINRAVVKPDGLRDRVVTWMDQSIPETNEKE